MIHQTSKITKSQNVRSVKNVDSLSSAIELLDADRITITLACSRLIRYMNSYLGYIMRKSTEITTSVFQNARDCKSIPTFYTDSFAFTYDNHTISFLTIHQMYDFILHILNETKKGRSRYIRIKVQFLWIKKKKRLFTIHIDLNTMIIMTVAFLNVIKDMNIVEEEEEKGQRPMKSRLTHPHVFRKWQLRFCSGQDSQRVRRPEGARVVRPSERFYTTPEQVIHILYPTLAPPIKPPSASCQTPSCHLDAERTQSFRKEGGHWSAGGQSKRC